MRGNALYHIFECVPEIDFNSGYKYFLGNMDNYKQGLMAILKSVKAKLPILHTMIRTDEYEGLRTITQTLRRMMSNVGAVGISELSYDIELVLLNQENEKINDHLMEYVACLESFIKNLEVLVKRLEVNQGEKICQEPISFGSFDSAKTMESIKLSSHLLKRKII